MQTNESPRKKTRLRAPEASPYVLRQVAENLPLSEDNTTEPVFITCVEHWNGNLYVGTSASELLHLVAIPAEREGEPPSYILASRLQPGGINATPLMSQTRGVQQILVLPGPMRACVLCNGVASFYTLPELSPASGRELPGVQWIGGLDENEGTDSSDGCAVMLAEAKRIRVVRIGEKLRALKTIDYPGCQESRRRETIACVANENGYALLEIEHQQQIPLFSISTASEHLSPVHRDGLSPSGHARSKSLGNPLSPPASVGDRDSSPASGAHNLGVPDAEPRASSPASSDSRSGRPRSSTDGTERRASYTKARLRPHILSPTPSEFMLTTGTKPSEPGVGVFVDLDGEVVRGTIEFATYPEAVISYNFDASYGDGNDETGDDTILALLDRSDATSSQFELEIQRLTDASTARDGKVGLMLPASSISGAAGGLCKCLTRHRHVFSETIALLRAVRFKTQSSPTLAESDPRTKVSIDHVEQEAALFDSSSSPSNAPTPEYQQQRDEDELKFASRLGVAETSALVWAGSQVWYVVQSPALFQLEHALSQAISMQGDNYSFDTLNVSVILSLMGTLQGREATTETEFITFNYIKQKAGLALFLHLQTVITRPKVDIESLCQIVRKALLDSELDPRIALALVTPLSRECVQGPNGMWLHQGLVVMLEDFRISISSFEGAPELFWLMLWQYLSDWQDKRGYGSIADEKFVFDSVDASLLHLLLHLDQTLAPGSGAQKSVHAKLNTVVDSWKGDFNRATALLQHYRRLYVLSRLYQSKKLAKDVLATWKRIVEGEEDRDQSLTVAEVEAKIGWYLTKIGNVQLVQEYGLWLARRNADLAVQVFSDDQRRVKLSSTQVLSMLKEQAPNAVQQYLEHLVFSKHLDQYADDLIGYYLDSVLSVLESSEDARRSLDESYSAYRALAPPKPTYLNFIQQNAPPQMWWQARLRLLQLLGSGGYASSGSDSQLTYSVGRVLDRLAPYSSSLVSESIVLDARQGRHKEALRLLTHGLGDYDTAVRYCYFGGPSQSSHPVDAALLPSHAVQQDLFQSLFHEFLQIEDHEERIERTSHLLGTFATWFDALAVLDQLPQEWPVATISDFLVRTFRAAGSARNKVVITKALSASQYLQKHYECLEIYEKLGGRLETDQSSASQAQDDLSAVPTG